MGNENGKWNLQMEMGMKKGKYGNGNENRNQEMGIRKRKWKWDSQCWNQQNHEKEYFPKSMISQGCEYVKTYFSESDHFHDF